MKNVKKNFIPVLLSLLMFGCASTRVHLESQPSEADVLVYNSINKTYKKIGKTPFIINGEKNNNVLKNSTDFLAFKIQKNGYAIEHIIYDLNSKKNFKYLLQLKKIETWNDKDGNISSKLAGDIAKRVQKLNSLISNKNLNKAMTLTQELIDQYPKAHIFYDIKGSIHLLKGNKQFAIASLKKSLLLNPENVDSEQLLRALVGEKR